MDYRNYGDRGITICNRWLGKNGFQNFYKDMGEMPKDKTLDRKDNNGNYCKRNCCWSTRVEQQNNRRNNIFINHQNKRQTVAQWAKELKISDNTLRSRLRKTGVDVLRVIENNMII